MALAVKKASKEAAVAKTKSMPHKTGISIPVSVRRHDRLVTATFVGHIAHGPREFDRNKTWRAIYVCINQDVYHDFYNKLHTEFPNIDPRHSGPLRLRSNGSMSVLVKIHKSRAKVMGTLKPGTALSIMADAKTVHFNAREWLTLRAMRVYLVKLKTPTEHS